MHVSTNLHDSDDTLVSGELKGTLWGLTEWSAEEDSYQNYAKWDETPINVCRQIVNEQPIHMRVIKVNKLYKQV